MKSLHHSTVTALAIALAGMSALSCSPRKGGWRTYSEIVLQPAAPAHVHDHGGMAMGDAAPAPSGMPTGEPADSGSLAWTTPQGWTEEGGSGMRLASFHISTATATGLCTVVILSGDAGGPAANVRRWIGQIGLEAPPDSDLDAFLARQERFTSEGGFQVLAVDLTQFPGTERSPQASMLGALFPVGESTAFVKLTGPAALLGREKSSFIAFCKSIRKQ